jgi:YceI-like domain
MMTRRESLDHRDPAMTDHPRRGDDPVCRVTDGGQRACFRTNARLARDAERCVHDCSLNDFGGCVMASTTGSQQASVGVPAGTWSVDPVHSTVEFQVRNMGIVWVRGFTDFQGTVESTGEPGGVRASGTVEVASLDTRSAQRDQHLRAAEFFDLENQALWASMWLVSCDPECV